MRHRRLDACGVPVGAVGRGRAMLEEVAAALEAGVPFWMSKREDATCESTEFIFQVVPGHSRQLTQSEGFLMQAPESPVQVSPSGQSESK